MDMITKVCTKEDIPALVHVSTQSYLQHYTYLWLDRGEGYMRNNFNVEKFEQEMADSNAVFFLMYEEEQVIGLVKLNVNKAVGQFSAMAALELERIYLIKEAAGKGLGKQAIKFVADFARQRNKKLVWLKCMENSDAFLFYQKMNFQIIGETKLVYLNAIESLAKMYIMGLSLNGNAS